MSSHLKSAVLLAALSTEACAPKATRLEASSAPHSDVQSVQSQAVGQIIRTGAISELRFGAPYGHDFTDLGGPVHQWNQNGSVGAEVDYANDSIDLGVATSTGHITRWKIPQLPDDKPLAVGLSQQGVTLVTSDRILRIPMGRDQFSSEELMLTSPDRITPGVLVDQAVSVDDRVLILGKDHQLLLSNKPGSWTILDWPAGVKPRSEFVSNDIQLTDSSGLITLIKLDDSYNPESSWRLNDDGKWEQIASPSPWSYEVESPSNCKTDSSALLGERTQCDREFHLRYEGVGAGATTLRTSSPYLSLDEANPDALVVVSSNSVFGIQRDPNGTYYEYRASNDIDLVPVAGQGWLEQRVAGPHTTQFTPLLGQ